MYPTPQGFLFAALAAGFRYQSRNDLALVLSDRPATAAGMFTTNRFQAAPILACRENLACGTARAVLVNAGQANACTGDEGLADCRATLDMTARALGIEAREILPASTGVIGDRLIMDRWRDATPELARRIGSDHALDVAKAIMTTDTFPKMTSRRVPCGTGQAVVLGMAKGAGMIAPNMATMLAFLFCDAGVEHAWLKQALERAVKGSFNSVVVDGDTSTNDTVLILANAAAGRPEPDQLSALERAITEVCASLAHSIAQDAEGGTKVLRIMVRGAKSSRQAELAARTVGLSPLVKTAMYGRDPNWGRIVAALGRSGADFDPDRVSVAIGGETVFVQGRPVDADWDAILKPVLTRSEIDIDIHLGAGRGTHEILASDFTEEYIRINAAYRT